MIGAAGLKGPGMAAAFARPRLIAASRSTRSISTFRSQRLRISNQGSPLSMKSAGSVPWRLASVATAPAAVRFNSSLPDNSPAPTPEATDSGALPEASDLADFDITTVPEKLGYLKELGLDFGWGPTSIVQYVVEHIHIWGDLPWWASIVGVGLLIRLALIKPMIAASDNASRLHNLKPTSEPLRQEMTRALQEGNQIEVHRKRAQLNQLNEQAGIKVSRSFWPMIQVPFGYGVFRLVRAMTALPVPAMMNESVLWLNDLSIADPTYILPILTSTFMYLAFKKGGEVSMGDFFSTGPGKGMLIGLPVLSFSFIAFQPAALQLYFVTTGAWAVLQAHVLNNTSFRQRMGLAISDPALKNKGGLNMKLLENKSKNLADLHKRLADESRYVAEMGRQPAQSDQNLSSIDRWVNKSKKTFENIAADAGQKMRNFSGQSTKNADGSDAAAPRLTDAERQRAEGYEKERQSMDAFARAERNEARRRAHLQALAAERQKAKAYWQKQQEAAVNQQKRRK